MAIKETSLQIPQYLGPDGDHRYEQRQRGERGGFLDYCFERKKHGVHDCPPTDSPQPPVRSRIKLIWKARGSRRSF